MYSPAHELTGALQTVEASIDSRIPGRSKDLLIRWAPGDIGPRPIIIWSHGGSWNANGHNLGSSWSATFAEAGYIVVHPAVTALDTTQLQGVCQQVGVATPDECDDWTLYSEFGLTDVVCNDDPTCLAACPWAPNGCACNVNQNRCIPVGDTSPFAAIGAVRPWDIEDVISELGTLASALETNAGIPVDATKVIVAGWSGGSQSVLQSAGAKRSLSASVPRFAFEVDEPTAFIALSPQGPGFSGFYEVAGESSWDAISRPTLVITGDGDEKDANDLTGPVRRRPYELMPPGDKHLFYSTDPSDLVTHGTYNLSGWDPGATTELDPLYEAMRSVALAFVDRHLRDSGDAAAYLASDAPVRLVAGRADWTSK